ncbi:Nuclear migration protein unc-83 [Aphelenchoides besseyi]|nr:Nuclear migration protein unc-83 [Aphelenchoides besseyi]KAI6236862.1 Nuclear migration protein unc-83 [Aphelenchoides besseyi]
MSSEMEVSMTNSQMEDSNLFEKSINSKVSEMTSIFDPREMEAYKFHWSPSRSPSNHGEVNQSLTESMVFEKIEETRESLRKVFNESCSALHSDIHRALEDWETGQEIFLDDLLEREALTRAHGESLIELDVEMSEFVSLKMSTLSRSLEQLRIKHDSDQRIGFRDQSAAVQLRKWLQITELSIEQIKTELMEHVANLNELQRLRAALQTLQLEIDTEGRHLLRAAERHLTAKALEWTPESQKVQRLNRNFEVLKTRWCVLNLAGAECLERINNFIDRFTGSEEYSSDRESIGSLEPVRKRARRIDPLELSGSLEVDLQAEDENDEDVIPFGANEYEPLGPIMSDAALSDVEYENHRGQRVKNRGAMALISPIDDSITIGATLEHRTSSEDGWSSSKTHDVGYSSGENSIHEALNALGSDLLINPTESTQTDGDLERMRERPILAVSAYYRTVPLDELENADQKSSLHEVPKFNFDLLSENEPLSESLIVHADEEPMPALDDYSEVMRLLDETPLPSSLQMGTSWTEVKSAAHARRISTPGRTSGLIASSAPKINRYSLPNGTGGMSCDASSEDSDVNDGRLNGQMSISFNGRTSCDFLGTPTAHAYSQPSVRKRRLPRSTPHALPIPTSTPRTNSSSVLRNLAMDQSIYVPQMELMSRSLNVDRYATGSTKRRVLRRRMRRTASDSANVGIESKEVESRFLLVRRNSMESNSSSTTFQESGDAHFEWDEYTEEPLNEDVTMAPNSTIMNGIHQPNVPSSTTPILSPLDLDEDFQTELPLVDVNENLSIRSFLHQTRRTLDDAIRQLQDQMDDERAQSLEDIERLHEQWLLLIEQNKIPSPETLNAVEVNKILEQFRLIRSHHSQLDGSTFKLDSQLTPSASYDDLNVATMEEEKELSTVTPVVGSRSFVSRVGTSIRENQTLRSILSCFVLMGFGLILLSLVADDEIFTRSGHWTYKFGPQLRYVQGPPPV